MSQERGPGALSAEEIAYRIGASVMRPRTSIGERVGATRARPPEPVGPPEPLGSPEPVHGPVPLGVFPARIATQRIDQRPVEPVRRRRTPTPPPTRITQLSEPRRRLIRDAAATLVGVSALVLIAIAVAPPPPDGGVLNATATPPAVAESSEAVGAASPVPAGASASDPSPMPTP